MNIQPNNNNSKEFHVISSEVNGFSLTISTPVGFIQFETAEELEEFFKCLAFALFTNSKNMLNYLKN